MDTNVTATPKTPSQNRLLKYILIIALILACGIVISILAVRAVKLANSKKPPKLLKTAEKVESNSKKDTYFANLSYDVVSKVITQKDTVHVQAETTPSESNTEEKVLLFSEDNKPLGEGVVSSKIASESGKIVINYSIQAKYMPKSRVYFYKGQKLLWTGQMR